MADTPRYGRQPPEASDIAMTLINPRPDFVERIRLHQLVAVPTTRSSTTPRSSPRTSRWWSTPPTHRRAARTVTLGPVAPSATTTCLCGRQQGAAPTVPGRPSSPTRSPRWRRPSGCGRRWPPSPAAPVTVVGAGPTGIETAAELGEQGHAVTLVCGGVLGPYLHGPGRSGGQADGQAGRDGARRAGHEGDGGARTRCCWPTAASCAARDHLDRRLRRARPGRPQRAGHRRDRPPAHRRDADERRRPVHRRRRRRRRAVGPAAADELPGGDPAGRAGRQHGAQPHRGHRARGGQPGVRRPVHQPGPQGGIFQLAHLDDRAMPLYVGGRAAATIKEAVCKGTVSSWPARPASPVRTSGSRAASGRSGWRRARRRRPMSAGRVTNTRTVHALRPLLFTIAYEMLGSATEADDVLQESYLRWAEVDLATVQDTKAYLAQLVTRQALNALRAQARRREDYVGPWLPEPLLRRRRRRRVGRRARRVGVDGDDGGARDAGPRRARRVRAARGVRLRPRRNRLGDRQVHARRCVRSRTAPASTSRRAASGSSPSTRSRRWHSPRSSSPPRRRVTSTG